jgi:hypothetical protein
LARVSAQVALVAVASPSFYQEADNVQFVLMKVRLAIYAFAEQAKDLLGLLRSSEGNTLTRSDLDVLEVQLYLLEKEVTKRKKGINPPPANR